MHQSQIRLTTPGLVQLLAREGRTRLREEFASTGMTGLRPVHSLLLMPLVGGGLRAAHLADLLSLSRQAVAQAVAGLEADGYVERSPDPGDARAKLICLTPLGRTAVRAVRSNALALERDWQDRIGEHRLTEFRETLALLLAHDD